MAVDVTIFMIFESELAFNDLKDRILDINKENIGYIFSFEKNHIFSGYESAINKGSAFLAFLNVSIESIDYLLELVVEYTDGPSDVYALSLLKSEDYQVILEVQDVFFIKVKMFLKHCLFFGHDRGMTGGIGEIYEKYKNGENLTDMHLFLA